MNTSSSSFVKAQRHAISIADIVSIDATQLEQLLVTLHLRNGQTIQACDGEALDIVMRCQPSLVEGKRFSFAKRAWVLHNFVGHPLMQLLAFFRCYKKAFLVHEVTVPRPLGIKEN